MKEGMMLPLIGDIGKRKDKIAMRMAGKSRKSSKKR